MFLYILANRLYMPYIDFFSHRPRCMCPRSSTEICLYVITLSDYRAVHLLVELTVFAIDNIIDNVYNI